MTTKFLHVRELDRKGELSPTGGLTVAYSIVDSLSAAGICLNLAKCRSDDLFCFKTGREIAARKLLEQGPLDVLPLEHPFGFTIVDWICTVWWPEASYGGFVINIFQDFDRSRRNFWYSDFRPLRGIE